MYIGYDENQEALRAELRAYYTDLLTDEVRASGLGDVVNARLNKSIRQIALIQNFTKQPTAVDIFDQQYLPAPHLRQVPGS